ncbi:MAG: NAD(P)-dependent oxidoreductase [Chromatiales bacterium]|nr:NAD(P)-dependent oxidoreductase [Chromatiales bacterium]
MLVTGASGFLGAWIIGRLRAGGWQVDACDLRPDPTLLRRVEPAAAEGVAWHPCDVADGAAVDALVRETRPDRIVHLAALLIPGCRADPVAGARVNVIGHVNVLLAAIAHGIDRVVYTSSMAAKPRGPANAPANLYGVLKRTGEEVSRIFHLEHGLSSVGLRPNIVYGVGREAGETAAITLAMRAAAFGEAYEIPWRTATCFQLAADVADVYVRLLDAHWDGAVVGDVSDVIETSDAVVDAIRTVVPDARVSVAPEERIAPTTGFDVAALETLIGPLTRTELADGARRTIEHYRRIGA